MKTDWLWDKNITEGDAKKTLSDRNNQNFIAYAALLLSRSNSAHDVFHGLITKENFFVAWSRIKKQMRKNAWNDPRIEYWQAIYETLKENEPALKQAVGSSKLAMRVSVFSIAHDIGLKIKALREQSGLTQKDLAKKLKIAQQIISRIESGRQNVSVETLSGICEALGVPFNVEKLGLSLEPDESKKTDTTYPFGQKSPEEFVKIVFEIVSRSKEYVDPQYYDGTNDKGRDIIAYKYAVGKKELWYFQCKRYTEISFFDFKIELEKIAKYSKENNNFRPDGIVFVTACKISPDCRTKTKKYAQGIGLGEIIFWSDVELSAKAKIAGVHDELFPITKEELSKKAKEFIEQIISENKKSGSIYNSIDFSQLNQEKQLELRRFEALVDILERNFEVAYKKLKELPHWSQQSYEEKFWFARIFFSKGGIQQAKDIYGSIEQEAQKRKDMWFYVDMSLIEVLLNNKALVLQYAQQVKGFADDSLKEKTAYSHYNALMLRYVYDNEANRLTKGLLEYDSKFPEDKIIVPIKALEEDGSITNNFKEILSDQKEWYQEVKKIFQNQMIPSYRLEKILQRPYVEILSYRSWDEFDFRIQLMSLDKVFEDSLMENLEKAESLVFDYASLLNLSKMNLLGFLEKIGKKIYISEKLFEKIQYELLQVEQVDLRNLWRFLKDSKTVCMEEIIGTVEYNKKCDQIFDPWLIDSLCLSKKHASVFILDDFRLINYFQLEEAIKSCNSPAMLKYLLKRGWIDRKMYATSIGDLAERFYIFLPFSGDDLFHIVMEDKSKITLRTHHLVNEMFLPGSIVSSFTVVFVRFISLLWETGVLPEDKVEWLSFLSERVIDFIEQRLKENKEFEVEPIALDRAKMWVIAVQKSGKDEILFLEKKIDTILEKPWDNRFKEAILSLIKARKIVLGIV